MFNPNTVSLGIAPIGWCNDDMPEPKRVCVQGQTFTGGDHARPAQLPASSQMGHINTICHTLEETEPEEKTSIGPLLEPSTNCRTYGLRVVRTSSVEPKNTTLPP